MEIIKHGKIKKRMFACVSCGCEFIAETGEFEKIRYTNGFSFYCRCPECGSEANIFVNDKELENG